MKQCSNCGTSLSNKVRFCPQCGNSVSESQNNSAQDNECEIVRRGGVSTFAIVLCSIALLLVIVLVVIKVVECSKPKYRIVYKTQTEQTTTKNETPKRDNGLAKKEETVSPKETPFISGLSNWNLYGADGGSYVYKGDGLHLNVSLSLYQSYIDLGWAIDTVAYMNCVISDGWGNSDSIPLVDSDCVEDDFTPENNQYIIGQHDFDNNGVNEIVIGLFNSSDGYDFWGIAVFSVSDNSSWRFDCSVEKGGCAQIDNNEIRVQQDCRKIAYHYVFEDGNFVDYSDM